MPRIYTVKEVADILGFSTNTIYAFLKEKRIKGVRVGRGRFRIPEEELTRILHLSKKPVAPVTPFTPIREAPVFELIKLHVSANSEGMSELYMSDWFIGIAAVITGFALFLFDESFSVGSITSYVPAIQAMLIVSGLGLLLSNIYKKYNLLHKVLQVFLGIVIFAQMYRLLQVNDTDGMILFATLGMLMLITTVVRMHGAVFIGVLTTVLGAGTIGGFIFNPGDVHLVSLTKMIGLSSDHFLLLVSCIAAVNLSMYWIGLYSKRKFLFIISCAVAGVIFLWTAGIYAQLMSWSLSFFYLVLSFFCIFLPVWREIDVTHKGQRQILQVFFAGISGVLIVAVLFVYAIHSALWEQRKLEMVNKVSVGRSTVESAMESILSTMITSAENQFIVGHAAEHDTERIGEDIKILYESNPLIHRIVVLDANGNGVALYPFGDFDQENYAFQEYFTRVRDTREPYITVVFVTSIGGLSRPVISVTTPLVDGSGEFIGVMSASVNVDKLALRLEQIAQKDRREFFILSDTKNRYMIHPDSTKVGQSTETSDTSGPGNESGQGVIETVLSDQTYGLVSYDRITRLQWGIKLEVPAGSVVIMNAVSLLLVFGTVFIMFIVAVGGLAVLRVRWMHGLEGGP